MQCGATAGLAFEIAAQVDDLGPGVEQLRHRVNVAAARGEHQGAMRGSAWIAALQAGDLVDQVLPVFREELERDGVLGVAQHRRLLGTRVDTLQARDCIGIAVANGLEPGLRLFLQTVD